MERRIVGRVKGDATEEFSASQGFLGLQVTSFCAAIFSI